MGTMFSLIFNFSCSKDEITKPTNPSNQSIPSNPKNSITDDFQGLSHEIPYTPILTTKEVNEVIQAKELLRTLIKESLIQLLFNSHFNPNMPMIDTRMACMTCPEADCGCPYQDESLDPDINVFPQLLSLKYYDPEGCDCTLITSPTGLEVHGEIRIKFSDPFDTLGHKLTLYPQDNFIVDGYDIDADSIELENLFGDAGMTLYKISALENVTVTRNGDVTNFNSIGGKSRFTIIDVGLNHGSINNAYGLLDDIFRLRLRQLSITCSNGETVTANSGEDLIYDMDCSSIEDGMVDIFDSTNTRIATYDYGAPAMGSDPGVCDDSILVTIPQVLD
ncbi:MAG: hypothetical protein AB8H03_03875 [Saprospiraceae bacterium]